VTTAACAFREAARACAGFSTNHNSTRNNALTVDSMSVSSLLNANTKEQNRGH
jgi:hypothetical protein